MATTIRKTTVHGIAAMNPLSSVSRRTTGASGRAAARASPITSCTREDAAAGSKILLYHIPPDVRGEWKTEVLDDTMHATHGLDVMPLLPSVIVVVS